MTFRGKKTGPAPAAGGAIWWFDCYTLGMTIVAGVDGQSPAFDTGGFDIRPAVGAPNPPEVSSAELRFGGRGLYVITVTFVMLDALAAADELAIRLPLTHNADIANGVPHAIHDSVDTGPSLTFSTLYYRVEATTAITASKTPLWIDIDGTHLTADRRLDYARVSLAYFADLG